MRNIKASSENPSPPATRIFGKKLCCRMPCGEKKRRRKRKRKTKKRIGIRRITKMEKRPQYRETIRHVPATCSDCSRLLLSETKGWFGRRRHGRGGHMCHFASREGIDNHQPHTKT